jgi:hypothetical protein
MYIGDLYSWGQNSCGQLGSGPSKAGFLRDEVKADIIIIAYLHNIIHDVMGCLFRAVLHANICALGIEYITN